jgi:hypothetical protein
MNNTNEDNILPNDDESREEWLDRLFPQAPDGTLEWLCYALSPSQVAIVSAMLRLNADDCQSDESKACYNQRIQRLRRFNLTQDNASVIDNVESWAYEFALRNRLD